MVSYELRRAERTNERTATSIAERTPFGVPKVWRSGIAQRSAAFVQVEKPDDHMVRRRSRPDVRRRHGRRGGRWVRRSPKGRCYKG